MHLRREEIESFHATDYDIDTRTGIVLLRYAFSGGAAVGGVFEERIDLGGSLLLDPEQEASFEHLVRLLHAVTGTSYYKAAAPPIVSVDSGPLTPLEVQFVDHVYDKGLREFAYKNGLPVPTGVEVRARIEEVSAPDTGGPPPGIAIPIGGGKDSIVVIESLRDLDAVGRRGQPGACRAPGCAGCRPGARRGQKDHRPCALRAERRRRSERARSDDRDHLAHDGGGRLRARLLHHGHGARGLGRRADPARRTCRGKPSMEQVERVRDRAPRRCSGAWRRGSGTDLLCVSCPSSRYRAALPNLPRYHRVFRSCNRAFALAGATDGWCNRCPKCRFVYLMLATALDREQMAGIFGRDLLGEPEQVDGFRDLLEIARKPFECVGTRRESIEALSELKESPVWAGSVVLEELGRELELELERERGCITGRRRCQVLREAVARAGPGDGEGCSGVHCGIDSLERTARCGRSDAQPRQVGLICAGARDQRSEGPARRSLGHRPRRAGDRAARARAGCVCDDRAGPAGKRRLPG